MIRLPTLAILLVATSLGAYAEDGAAKPADAPKPADAAKPAGDGDAEGSVRDQASYQVGLQMAESVRRYELDPAQVIKGLQAGTSGTPPAQDMAAFQALMQKYQTELGKSMLEKNKVLLADNGKKKGVTTTASGLEYEVITSGTGKQPLETDTVSVNYKGTLPDGTVFDESAKHGGPATFPLKGVIKGWTEVLKLMKEGDKWRVMLPSDLAYGPTGQPPSIPPNQILIFEIELLKVLPPGAPTPHP